MNGERVRELRFVYDLDGTIVFRGQPVSDAILRALLKLEAAGHEIIFASARPVRDMLPVIPSSLHHCTMIGGNGSLMGRNGKVTACCTFPNDLRRKLMQLIEKYRTPYLIDGEWDYVYTGPADHPILNNLDHGRLARNVSLDELQPVVKLLLLLTDPEDMDVWSEALSRLNVSVHLHHRELIIDICPSGINKWTALQSLGIDEGTYIAFGNDSNDLTMLQHAHYAVRIGDYKPLADYADETIPLDGDADERIAERIVALAQQFRQA